MYPPLHLFAYLSAYQTIVRLGWLEQGGIAVVFGSLHLSLSLSLSLSYSLFLSLSLSLSPPVCVCVCGCVHVCVCLSVIPSVVSASVSGLSSYAGTIAISAGSDLPSSLGPFAGGRRG
jgi:hypothetical protein